MAMSPDERRAFRARICAEAFTRFVDRPIGDVTLQEIADALGVSFWVLYRQYESREALYRAAIAPVFDRIHSKISVPTAENISSTIKGSVRFAASLMTISDYRHMVLLLARDRRLQPWLNEAYIDKVARPLVSRVEASIRKAAQRNGILIAVKPGSVAAVVRKLELIFAFPTLLPEIHDSNRVDGSATLDRLAAEIFNATHALDPPI